MSDTTAPAYRWHVGSNVPGYLSESAPVCCESPAEARDALIAELERSRDALPGCDHDEPTGGCEPCGLWAALDGDIVDARKVDVTEGYSVAVDVGRSLPIMHWVARYSSAEFSGHTTCQQD